MRIVALLYLSLLKYLPLSERELMLSLKRQEVDHQLYPHNLKKLSREHS